MLHSFIFFLRRFLTVTVRSYWNSHILFFKCYFSSSISDLVNLYTLEAFAIHIIAICRFPIDSWIPIDFLHIHVPGEIFLVTHKWTSVAPREFFARLFGGIFDPFLLLNMSVKLTAELREFTRFYYLHQRDLQSEELCLPFHFLFYSGSLFPQIWHVQGSLCLRFFGTSFWPVPQRRTKRSRDHFGNTWCPVAVGNV